MGNSKSTTAVEKPVEVESSSGFHVLELHLPTAGFGLVTLVVFALWVIGLHFCYRCLRRRWFRQSQHQFLPVRYDATAASANTMVFPQHPALAAPTRRYPDVADILAGAPVGRPSRPAARDIDEDAPAPAPSQPSNNWDI